MEAISFIKRAILLLLINLFSGYGSAQGFSFTEPVPSYPLVHSDRHLAVVHTKDGEEVVAWKDSGQAHRLLYMYMKDGAAMPVRQELADAGTNEAPLLLQSNGITYLFWVNDQETIEYAVRNYNEDFKKNKQPYLSMENGKKVSVKTIAGTVKGDSIFLSGYEWRRNRHIIWKFTIGADGELINNGSAYFTAPAMSPHVSMQALGNNIFRFFWVKKGAYYVDYLFGSNKQNEQLPVIATDCKSLSVFFTTDSTHRKFVIWNGNKKNDRLYYSIANDSGNLGNPVPLPAFQPAIEPVIINKVGDFRYKMIYRASDRRYYSSFFFRYDPANWMGSLLLPGRIHQTLQDIVIPGSHDAGMSVLTAAGGQQKGTINECNTLTQVLPIHKQLQAGIRMFDIRVGVYNGLLYTKHASSDCMEDAIGGGYGEPLKEVMLGIKDFLHANNREIVIMTFSHFCDREITMANLANSLLDMVGRDIVFKRKDDQQLHEVKLKDLAGKIVLNFEIYKDTENYINTGTLAKNSDAFINFVRAYASTNDLKKLLITEEFFFLSLKNGVRNNELVRLDWQLTQSIDEAAMSCNAFQSENVGVLLNTTILLINKINKHKSILNLARTANRLLAQKLNEWIKNGTINEKNKPNILYVDDAGIWITDYCVSLNEQSPYFPTKPPH